MSKTYKDTDLREALQRKYADTPRLPPDFMERLARRMERQPKAHRAARVRRVAAAALAVAAGIVAVVLIVQPRQPGNALVATPPAAPSIRPAGIAPAGQQASAPSAKAAPPARRRREKAEGKPAADSCRAALATQSDPHLHYVAQTAGAAPYQPPRRMEEFVRKMADYHGVKGEALDCAASRGDTVVVSMAYVFDDTKELNLFGRLLQAACCYDDQTPGYLLNYSHRQFFFQLKDLRLGLKYLWIAERVGGRILLYATRSPIGAEVSSDCFREYRDKLTNTNINQTTRVL